MWVRRQCCGGEAESVWQVGQYGHPQFAQPQAYGYNQGGPPPPPVYAFAPQEQEAASPQQGGQVQMGRYQRKVYSGKGHQAEAQQRPQYVPRQQPGPPLYQQQPRAARPPRLLLWGRSRHSPHP